MNNDELYGLYSYLDRVLNQTEDEGIEDAEDIYLVDEVGLQKLYYQMLTGKATRKDFLLFAIKDMIAYIDKYSIDARSTLLLKFRRVYLDKL